MTGQPLRPRPLEVASGLMFGIDPDAPPLPEVDRGLTPRNALEEAIRPALERPPCVVTFSGGRDSSAILALAAHVARREGLPLPVPATLHYPSSLPLADESAWQRCVVDRVAPEDWSRREVGDGELDLVGPWSTSILEKHGVLWPANSFVHAPMLELARGGALLTGVGGDDFFGSWRWERAASVLSRRTPIRPRDLPEIAYALAPVPVRRVLARREAIRLAWLTTAGSKAARRAFAETQAPEPFKWDAVVAWRARLRYVAAMRWSLGKLADEAGVHISHPFLHPRFLAALARDGGRRGFGDRTAVMQTLFEDLLPPVIVERTTKATFDEVFFGPHTRAFAESWDGRGVDHELVSAESLRAAWQQRVPPATSATSLQSAWLASRKDRQLPMEEP